MGRRFVVLGAGAIGGVVAARLHESGAATVVVARGPHLRAIQRDGLTVASPTGRRTVDLPAVGDLADIDPDPDDVVLLAVKSQDTPAALDQLQRARDGAIPPVVCLQNSVDNEPLAGELTHLVLGGQVFLPAVHLEPGIVVEHAVDPAGVIDVGRWPSGDHPLADEVAAALTEAGFLSQARPDIDRWKHTKLLFSLSNIVGALCGAADRHGPVTQLARQEALAVFAAAGIETVTDDAFRARTTELAAVEVEGRPRPGNSTWQSLARGSASVETGHLNGAIVRLGEQHGLPTPVNEALVSVAHEVAAGASPRRWTGPELLERVTAATS